jgi:hypothetical protein
MRTKRNLIFLVVAALLATLVTSAFATSSVYSSTPSLVGKWHVIIESENMPQAAAAFQTYFADGNFVEFNTFRESGNGVWMGSGNTYVATFGGFVWDEEGNVIGEQKVRASIKMDGPDHLIAEWVYDTIDAEGNVTEGVDTGTYEGTRVEVELP